MNRAWLLSLTGALLLLPGAASAASWLAPTPASLAGADTVLPQVAGTPGGELGIAYQRTTDAPRVVARLRSAGGVLGDEKLLSLPDAAAKAPAIAAAPDGRMIVAWVESQHIGIAVRAPGTGEFVALPRIPVEVQQTVRDVEVAIGISGRALVLAQIDNVENQLLDAWAVAPGAPEAVPVVGTQNGHVAQSFELGTSGPNSISIGEAAIDHDDRLFLSWTQYRQFSFTIEESTRVASGTGTTFGAPVVLDTASDSQDTRTGAPGLGTNGTRTVVAWGKGNYETGAAILRARDVSAGVLGAEVVATPTADHPARSRVRVDADGTALIAWEERESGFSSVGLRALALTQAAGAAPGVGQLLSDDGPVRLGSLDVAPDGSALAVVHRGGTDTSQVVRASLRAPGGSFASAQVVSPALDGPFLGPADGAFAGGVPHVIWTSVENPGSGTRRAAYAVHDGRAPRIDGFTVPASAQVGQTVAFAAAVSDDLSPVTGAWDFGDGSGAAGTTPGHAYAAAGDYTVTFTATDGAGNQSTRSAAIRVTVPAPAPTPTPATGTPADRTAPVISRLSMTRKRFRVARGATAKTAATRRGTSFRLTLSERASVTVTLLRGRRTVGRITRSRRPAGRLSILFSGRIGRKALGRGRHTARLTAVDAAGNRSRTRTITFTVVR